MRYSAFTLSKTNMPIFEFLHFVLLKSLFSYSCCRAVRSVDKMNDLQQLKTEKDPSQCSGLVSGLTAMRNTLLRESKDLEFCNREVQACMSSLFTVGKTTWLMISFKRVLEVHFI